MHDSALNNVLWQAIVGHALLRGTQVATIVVEYRDRFGRFGVEYVDADLAASGRRLLVVDPAGVDEDPAGVDDDLVGDVTEILTSLCFRLYGREAAADRVRRAVAAAVEEAREGPPGVSGSLLTRNDAQLADLRRYASAGRFVYKRNL
ncbi:site-specific integrase-resolvase-like [Frankia casuarinae]|uniref:Site-specific integrase-resolvase-like n=1 Tax=Frankia casuarinae (strain DSM 45818 / CECT 9043 / HFP020203 / CcI3) TaxID=106370 RepID=Q2JBK7_FRACC|nr:site-specific integrase-resolvase-like [Frankia casuarinae]